MLAGQASAAGEADRLRGLAHRDRLGDGRRGGVVGVAGLVGVDHAAARGGVTDRAAVSPGHGAYPGAGGVVDGEDCADHPASRTGPGAGAFELIAVGPEGLFSCVAFGDRGECAIGFPGVGQLLVTRIIEPTSKLDILVRPAHVIVPMFG
jgi:hypothetical protein